ncbi:hypothetical protein [Roseibium sp.]|uniref:hypothetical protein n=1 Tax=Roseibium sp. TaxID=1936156 RepID=UPI003B501829
MSSGTRKTVLIFGQLATYGGAGILADQFRSRGDWDVHLIVAKEDEPQGFWKTYGAKLWCDQNWFQRRRIRDIARKADLTILAGTPALDTWIRALLGKSAGKQGKTTYSQKLVRKGAQKLGPNRSKGAVSLLVTDSFLLSTNPETNELYNLFPEVTLFVMPDLIPFVERKKKIPFYPLVEVKCKEEQVDKTNDVLVGHSPSSEKRYKQKGTDFILEVFNRNDIRHDLISGLDYQTSLLRKSALDIFVDQMAPQKFKGLSWSGGLGKSGLEAMALGCAVITSGHLAETEPYLPLPPVLFTDRADFEEKLNSLVKDPEEVRRLGKNAQDWIAQYATPEAMVDHLLKYSDLPAHETAVN